MKELDQDNLKQLITENPKVVVQFGAAWCGNCKMIKPKFRRLSEATEGIEFFYVDAEKNPESRSLANVSNLPAFAAFLNGELKGEAFGTKFENVEGIVSEIAGN